MNQAANLCQLCRQWEATTTECRAKAPSADGWPRTKPDDWCGEWLKREVVQMTAPSTSRPMDMCRIGINFAYIRDFPDDACTWLSCILENSEVIPVQLRPLFQSPIGHCVTDLLSVEDADSILRYWTALPGGDNPLVGDESGILAYFDTAEDQSANMAVMASFAGEHPWVKMATPSLS